MITHRRPGRVTRSMWLAVDAPGSWTQQASCTQADPEVFFPAQGASAEPAKRICLWCPVRAECLAYALAHKIRFGVWGGLSGRERRPLRHRDVEVAPRTAMEAS